MQRESWRSTFSEQPGLSLASKAIIELFSMRASLMIDFSPKALMRLPATSIDFRY